MPGQVLRLSRLTLGVKLTLFTVGLVLAVCAAMAYFLVYRSASERTVAMNDQMVSLGRVIGGIRGSGTERQYDPFLIKILVEQSSAVGTNLCFVAFADQAGRLDGALNRKCLEAAAPRVAALVKGMAEEPALAALHKLEASEDALWIKKVPVVSGKGGPRLFDGTIGFSSRVLEQGLAISMRVNAVVSGVAFLLGLVAAVVLSRHFSRPIQEVAAAMQRVAGGVLDATLTVRSRDEVGVLAHSFNVMTQGLRERERIRSTFARYVSDQVAERILEEESDVGLRGELRQVTVLFLDIRGFTALTEDLRPREVVSLLNDYFEIIIDIIFRYEGTINKFIGDSIMAIYGAPSAIDLPELRAVITAVEIQRMVGEFNWRRMQEDKPVANFGIGIHSGEAIAGNIGSARRMEYTVIGRDVNLAQRIEAATREGQVLISEATLTRLRGLVEVQAMEPVFMKGILEPIPLYEITSVRVSSLEEARARVKAG